MLIEERVDKYIDLLASGEPTPGGGSTAALAGALSAALISMVANLTIGREKYRDVEGELSNIRDAAVELIERLKKAVDEDKAAYDQVMASFRMPKEKEKEKEVRAAAVQQAVKCAAGVPLEVARFCYELLQLAKIAAEKGNPNAASDAGVAALMADAAAKSAILNVRTNLSLIKDDAFVRELKDVCDTLFVKCEMLKNKILYSIEEKF
jgi:formiminotetrahydrofolate cyclodeaminase